MEVSYNEIIDAAITNGKCSASENSDKNRTTACPPVTDKLSDTRVAWTN
jgi:hypothetical protein